MRSKSLVCIVSLHVWCPNTESLKMIIHSLHINNTAVVQDGSIAAYNDSSHDPIHKKLTIHVMSLTSEQSQIDACLSTHVIAARRIMILPM